ncbi:MAG: DUF1836 domain-containing protein [Clostridia bacterium]|nr:DUF1836 domain-containing protein [Clostridia bacterium]
MAQKLVPGSTIPYAGSGGMFAMFRPLIHATDGLTLGQVCAITGLEPSTVQNWVKRRFVAHPVGKKYRERQLARILLISALRDCMKIDSIGALMAMVNGSADDESDDIIPEERMYDYLCAIIGQIGGNAPAVDAVPRLVQQVTADYDPPDEIAAKRLHDALTVMVCAYTAAQYKKEAELKFRRMKEEEVS